MLLTMALARGGTATRCTPRDSSHFMTVWQGRRVRWHMRQAVESFLRYSSAN